MNLLFFVSSLGAGGAERVASILCNAWASRGDRVTLVPTFSGGGEPFYSLDSRVELIYLSSVVGSRLDGSKQYLARLFAMRRLICDRKPDVVISFLPNVNIATLLASAFGGIPCVVCERSDPVSHPLPVVWRIACKSLYRFADTVLVQTNSVADSIGSVYGGIRRVSVIPNPVPKELLEFSAKLMAPRNRRILLSLGRLSKEKQVSQIINAFAHIAETSPDWDLHIYGDGPERESLSFLIGEHGLRERIFLKGRTDEPWRVMENADAFVMNSSFEGFPNALVEAMAVGLPCASSDCQSGPREISDNGKYALLFPVGDESGLRNALSQLTSDLSLRVSLGEKAHKTIISRFSMDAILREWDDMFRSLMELSS